MELIGWASAIALGLCSIPQAYKCWKEKHATGMSSTFVLLWLIGEILGVFYVAQLSSLPLLLNYIFNTFLVLIIAYYKFRDDIISR